MIAQVLNQMYSWLSRITKQDTALPCLEEISNTIINAGFDELMSITSETTFK